MQKLVANPTSLEVFEYEFLENTNKFFLIKIKWLFHAQFFIIKSHRKRLSEL